MDVSLKQKIISVHVLSCFLSHKSLMLAILHISQPTVAV